MNIVYAAEDKSIADVLGEYLDRVVPARDLEIRDNPDETGSFLIRWDLERFVLSPSGEVEPA